MQNNVGTVDRVIRIAVGAALIAWALYDPKAWWGWIGVVPLATGLIGWCALYVPLGLSTCATKK